MKERSDDELAALGLAGSAAALEELYDRYRSRLLGYAYRMTGDRAAAEDVFQQTFVTFFERLRRYEPRGKLAAYLFRVARSLAIDERAQARRARAPLPWAYSPAPPADAASEERAAAAAREEKAREAMLALPAHLREVVELRLYQDFDYARIAEITGLSQATARSRMRYALEALRAALGAARREESR